MSHLQTKRTVLRRFRLSDLENMRRLESDPDVMKYTPSRIPQSSAKTEERLIALIDKEAAYSPLGVWAVELKDTAEFVGWFMLIETEYEVPELGFMIVKDYWGRGFATEVANTLIDFGINKLKFSGIAAVTDSDNQASIHVLEKIGFKRKSSRIRQDKILGKELEAYIFRIER